MSNRPRSFFWPILFIGAGVLLLLANLNIIPLPSLSFLFRLWPVILIVAGLDILIGRRVPWVSGLVALVAVAGLVILAIFAPTLGWVSNPQARTGQFVEPVGEAEAARVTLNLTNAPANIHALNDSNNLIDANLVYVGEIIFDVQGTAQKTVGLRQQSDFSFDWSNPFSLSPEVRWDIGLTPDIPLELVVDAASGTADIDLGNVNLTGLMLDIGSGEVVLTLPAGTAHYNMRLDGGSGQAEIAIPADADVELEIDGGSGAIAIDAPEAAVRVEVRDSGSGEVRVPGSLRLVSGGEDDEGVWETDDYNSAERRVTITIDDVGSGSIVVR